MTLLRGDDYVKEGVQGKATAERPVIYMAGPTPTHETELGPVMEKIVERFWNAADFFDPASIHDAVSGGTTESGIDINDTLFWDSSGTFNTKQFMRRAASREDDELFDSLDELIEIPDIDLDLTDAPFIDFNLNPSLPTPFFELDLTDIPFIDIDLIGTDLKMGILKGLLDTLMAGLSKADGVLISRKADENMVGAALEMKEAAEQDIPIAVYDHDSHTDGKVPSLLDAHADYVTDNPYWAASWLIDEAENRKDEPVQEVDYPSRGFDGFNRERESDSTQKQESAESTTT